MRQIAENNGRKSHGLYSKKSGFDQIDKISQNQRKLSQKSIKFFEDEKYHQYQTYRERQNEQKSQLQILNLQKSDQSSSESKNQNKSYKNSAYLSPSRQIKIKFNQVSQENPFAQISSSEEADVISISKYKEKKLDEKIQNIPQNARSSNKLFGGIKRFSDQTQSLVSLKQNQEKERESLLLNSPFRKMTNFQSVIIARDNSNGQKTLSNGRRGHAPIQGQINVNSFKNQKSHSIHNKEFLNESQINKIKNQNSNIDVLNPEIYEAENLYTIKSKRSFSQYSQISIYDEAAGKKSNFMKSIEASLLKLQFVKQKKYIKRNQRSKSIRRKSQNSLEENVQFKQNIPTNIHYQNANKQKPENLSDIDDSNEKNIKVSNYDSRKLQNHKSDEQDNTQKRDQNVNQKVSKASEPQTQNKQNVIDENQKLQISALEQAIQIRCTNQYEDELPVPALHQNNLSFKHKQNKLNHYQIQYTLQEPIYDKLSSNVLLNFNKQSINQIEKNVYGLNQNIIQNLQKNPQFFTVFKQQKLIKQKSQESLSTKNDFESSQNVDKELQQLKDLSNKIMNKTNCNLIKQLILCLRQSIQQVKMKKQLLLNTFVTYCAIKIQKVFRGNFQRKYIYQFRKHLKTSKNFRKFLAIIFGWKTRRIFQLRIVINKCLKIKDHDNQKLIETFQKDQIKKSKQNLIKNFIIFLNNLLINDGQWLMLLKNETKDSHFLSYKVPQNKEEEDQILEELKQKYQIQRTSQLQAKPSQNNAYQVENKGQQIKRYQQSENYSYKNDKKKQEQMDNYLKRINYQPRLSMNENQKNDEKYNSNFYISNDGEIQYFQNIEEKLAFKRPKTAIKQSIKTSSFSRQSLQVKSPQNKFINIEPRVSLSQKDNERIESPSRFIVREQNIQARESLIKRNSYIPDLKKRFVVEIEQKIREESNPQTFLQKYIKRKQLRKSFPDRVDQNKQLTVNKSVLQLHNNHLKIKINQYFQRSQSSNIIEKQNIQRKSQDQKVKQENNIQNKYVYRNLRNSFQTKSTNQLTVQSKLKNNDIIDIEVQKYKQRKELRNSQIDRLNQNSQYSVKLSDIIKYSNKNLFVEDGPKDSFKNQYASLHKITVQNETTPFQIEKDQNAELKQQLKEQQYKLKQSQQQTNQMMQELLEKNQTNEIENYQITNTQFKLEDNPNLVQQSKSTMISFNSNELSGNSLKNPYINLGQQKKEINYSQIFEKSNQNIDNQQQQPAISYEEECQPIKPYVKKQSRQTVDKESTTQEFQPFNRSILQQLSPQVLNEDSQSFQFDVNQIHSKLNSEHKSSILNRTLKSELKRENDDSFAFKMEQISGLQSINFKSECKSPNDESFAFKLEKLSGLQSMQNKGSIFNQSNNRYLENDNDDSFGINLLQINNESKQASQYLNQSPISYVPSRYLVTTSPDKESYSFNVHQVDQQHFQNQSVDLDQNLNKDHDISLKQTDAKNYDSNQTFNKNKNQGQNDNSSHKKNDSEFTLGQESQRKDINISNIEDEQLQVKEIKINSYPIIDNLRNESKIQKQIEIPENSQHEVYTSVLSLNAKIEKFNVNNSQNQVYVQKPEVKKQIETKQINTNTVQNPYLNKYVFSSRQVSQNTNLSCNSSIEPEIKNSINIFNTKTNNLVYQQNNQMKNQGIFENLIKYNSQKKQIINTKFQRSLQNQDIINIDEKNKEKKIFQNQSYQNVQKNKNVQLNEYFQVLNQDINEYQNSTQVNSQNSSSILQNKQQGKVKQILKPYQQKNQNIQNMHLKNESSTKNFLARMQLSNNFQKKEIYRNSNEKLQSYTYNNEDSRTKSEMKEQKKTLKSQKQLEIIFNSKKKVFKEEKQQVKSQREQKKLVSQESAQVKRSSYQLLPRKKVETKLQSEAKESLTVDQTIQQIRARIQERLTRLNLQNDQKQVEEGNRSQDSNFKIQVIQMEK